VSKTCFNLRAAAARAFVPLAAISVFLLIGCGPGSDRLPISGKVTLDGAPLDGGAIRLTSLPGAKQFATGAEIKNGEFDIPRSKGLPPGTYHLEISAPDNSAAPVMSRGAPGERGIPTQPERIPPDFNIQSKKTIEVMADGDNHFVFEIVSRPAK
jgi:hypothetical protein